MPFHIIFYLIWFTLTLGAHNEGQGQTLSQPRHSSPPRSVKLDNDPKKIVGNIKILQILVYLVWPLAEFPQN